jgi:hypothetical protein
MIVPKLVRNYKPQGKRDIVRPKKRQYDQIHALLNRMNHRLICDKSHTLQRTHPHDIKRIWWCQMLVSNLVMIKLNLTCI